MRRSPNMLVAASVMLCLALLSADAANGDQIPYLILVDYLRASDRVDTQRLDYCVYIKRHLSKGSSVSDALIRRLNDAM
jgi:hypothetical protein